MSGFSVALVMIRRGLIAVSLCFATVLFAQSDEQPPQADTVAIQANETAVEKPVQGNRNSFKLGRNQTVIQCFEIIRQSIARKDYLAALPLIERVLSEPDSFVPSTNSNEVEAHEEIWRLLESMPPEIRQRFDEPRRIAAKQSWDEARNNGTSAINQFLQQFADSPYGSDAWWWIGNHERDHGRFQRAASAFETASNHPKATALQRAVSLLAGIDSLVAVNQQADAQRLARRLFKMDSNLSIEVGGASTTLGQALKERQFLRPTGEVLATPPANDASHDWRSQRPVLLPIWRQELTAPLRSSLETLESTQRERDIRPVPIARPVIIGEQVIIRTLDQISAFDHSTGMPRWSIPSTEFGLLGKRALENSALHGVATKWAQRRTQADSIFARMSTDGRRLFAIQEPDRASELRIDRESPRGLRGVFQSGPRFNKLCSYRIESGELEWEVGEAPAENQKDFNGCVFLGVPLHLDDQLFVIAQREVELLLLALAPETGKLRSSLLLGTAPLSIEEDLQRARVACPIVWHGGLLICSTSAGAVVAVDPIRQALKWAYHYPATSVSASNSNPDISSVNRDLWWESWREPFAAIARMQGAEPAAGLTKADAEESFVFVFTSPESDQLHALKSPVGELLWRVPRSGGLFVAGFTDELVIVIEGDSVRAHELRNGQLQWRTAVGEISGPGVIIGSNVLIPARVGGTFLVDTRTGRILSESSVTDSPMGTLADTEQGWITFQRQSLMLLPRLGEVRRRVDEELETDPSNESLRVRAALLDLQAGNEESARRRLTGLTSSPARDLRRQALIAALGRPVSEQPDVRRTDLARELTELADNADYKFAAAAAIGTSALSVNDFVSTVEAALAGLSDDFDPADSLIKRSSTMVRKDRFLLGLIDEAYRRAPPVELHTLDELFSVRAKQARKSRDRLAAQRLANLWRGIDWGRRLIVSEDEKSLRRRSFAETEFRLLDAAGSADSTVAAQALDRLVQQYERLSMVLESKAVRQRILHEFPDVGLLDGQTESERIAANPALHELVTGATKSIWPEVEPIVDPPQSDRNFGVYRPLVPMQIEPGSLAASLDVAIDRTGTEVVFRGGPFFQSGQDEEHERKFPLPKTMSQYRGPTGFMLREGWGIGRVVILLVGGELFAISPLDEQGEPKSRFLWSNPIDLQLPVGATRVVPSRPGIHDGRYRIVDESDRPIVKVGPVRASYLCYQTGNKLVAIDTETGRELWRRIGCPIDATIVGDDHKLFVWRDKNPLEIISPIDGRKLDDGILFKSPETMLHHRGSLVWTVTREESVQRQLELHDLNDGRLVWSRTDSDDALIAVLDPETLAIVTPEEGLNLLDARTGNPLCKPLAVNTSGMDDIFAWSDAQRWYIGLSGSVENRAALKALQPHDGFHVRLMNGPLYAVNRHLPKIDWKREFNNMPVSKVQSRVSPVIVQIWKNLPKGTRDAHAGTLRVLDSRSGVTLLEKSGPDVLPYYFLNPDPQQSILELKLTHETIRFNYDKSQ